jgi:1,6-anhydro-N-acetylmuramate kinase
MRTRWALGTMTGTSLDGLDVALVRAEGEGLAMRVHVESHRSLELGELQPRLRKACDGGAMTAGEFARLALDFGRLHAVALQALAGDRPIELAAMHGQTVHHAPPVSWQLVNPWPVAQALACAVVTDLRGGDLALGGQGAPITPLADWVLLRDEAPTAVVNLGGFCNITWLPAEGDGPDAIGGADICPCNHLLDAAARAALGQAFDRDGAGAASGHPDPHALADLRGLLARIGAARRSLGTGDEGVAWVASAASKLAPFTLLATVATAIGQCIGVAASDRGARRVVLAGGGARNRALRQAIEAAAGGIRVLLSDQVGLPLEARESAEMAVLGLLARDGVPITLPGVTGRTAPRCRDGVWCLPRTERNLHPSHDPA